MVSEAFSQKRKKFIQSIWIGTCNKLSKMGLDCYPREKCHSELVIFSLTWSSTQDYCYFPFAIYLIYSLFCDPSFICHFTSSILNSKQNFKHMKLLLMPKDPVIFIFPTHSYYFAIRLCTLCICFLFNAIKLI